MERSRYIIELSRWGDFHPYINNPFLVTSSAIRKKFAKEILEARVSFLNPPPKDKERITQLKAAQELGLDQTGVMNLKRKDSSPDLPLELATDKAYQVVEYMMENEGYNCKGRSIVTVDSVYEVIFPNKVVIPGLNDGKPTREFVIQKPNTKKQKPITIATQPPDGTLIAFDANV